MFRPQIPGNGAIGSHDFNASPQAVFTSFKLPKPGGTGPAVSTTAPSGPPPPSSAAELLAAAAAAEARFPLGGGAAGATDNKFLGSVTKMSAPLGGLPAMASQFAAAAAAAAAAVQRDTDAEKTEDKAREESKSPSSDLATANKDANSLENTPQKSSEGVGEGNSGDDTPPKNSGMIKARGTYYPLTAFPTTMPQGPVMNSSPTTTNSNEASSNTSGRTLSLFATMR